MIISAGLIGAEQKCDGFGRSRVAAQHAMRSANPEIAAPRDCLGGQFRNNFVFLLFLVAEQHLIDFNGVEAGQSEIEIEGLQS